MKTKYTLSRVAELAGVSPATVSRVFGGYRYVKPETRAIVLKVAKEVGFQPRKYRKHVLTTSSSTIVGIIVPDLENPFFLEIIRAMDEVFEANDVEVLVLDTNEKPSRETKNLSLLTHLRASGIVIAPTSESAEYNTAFLKKLHSDGLPVVLLDRDVKGIGFCGVFQNSYDASYTAVSTLLENGHKRIAIVAGPITAKPGLDRMIGYMDALKNNDIVVQQEYILYGDFKTESGYTLTNRVLQTHPEVTAVFAANNFMSLGALQAIHEAGLSIPNDISFISYGAIYPQFLRQFAGISEIVEPTKQMGVECANLMLEKMGFQGKKTASAIKRVSFDTHLVLRGSEKYPQERKSRLY